MQYKKSMHSYGRGCAWLDSALHYDKCNGAAGGINMKVEALEPGLVWELVWLKD